ncbi:unnamed protein product [Phaeothamnion confervicola]
MSSKAAAKMQTRESNVIAFPQALRTYVAIRCEETTRAAICSHCGGMLAKGESEDECSSARISRTS